MGSYHYISNYNNTYITMCASAAVIPITSFTIALTTLLSVLVQEYFYIRIPNTFNYITTCASAAVFLQPHSQYI